MPHLRKLIVTLAGTLFTGSSAPTLSTTVNFNEHGSYTFTVPAGVSRLTFTVVAAGGGGGGGGGADGAGTCSADVIATEIFDIEVGKGGDAGIRGGQNEYGGQGQDGGTTKVISKDNVTLDYDDGDPGAIQRLLSTRSTLLDIEAGGGQGGSGGSDGGVFHNYPGKGGVYTATLYDSCGALLLAGTPGTDGGGSGGSQTGGRGGEPAKALVPTLCAMAGHGGDGGSGGTINSSSGASKSGSAGNAGADGCIVITY